MELTEEQLDRLVDSIPCYRPKPLVRSDFVCDILPHYTPSEYIEAWRDYIATLRSQRLITRKAARQLRDERPWSVGG